jgi:hypothetical protein
MHLLTRSAPLFSETKWFQGKIREKCASAGRAPEHALSGAHASLPHRSDAHIGGRAHHWWGPVLRAERLAVTSRRGSSERAAVPEGEQWRSIRGCGGEGERRTSSAGGEGSVAAQQGGTLAPHVQIAMRERRDNVSGSFLTCGVAIAVN